MKRVHEDNDHDTEELPTLPERLPDWGGTGPVDHDADAPMVAVLNSLDPS